MTIEEEIITINLLSESEEDPTIDEVTPIILKKSEFDILKQYADNNSMTIEESINHILRLEMEKFEANPDNYVSEWKAKNQQHEDELLVKEVE